jgi:hypothetical protein
MQKCEKCKAAKQFYGVTFPSRYLCSCEEGRCERCGKPAVAAEFSRRVLNTEPPLSEASLYCKAHRPAGLPDIPAPKRRKSEPHISPAWTACFPNLKPPTADSAERVECADCRDVHAVKDRILFNGSQSHCPACKTETVFTHAWPAEERTHAR